MQDAVLNLCRVKMRDQQRLANGPLDEYPNREVGDVVPRSGNSSGGGQPGTALRCKPGGPNDYIYTIIQPQGWAPLMKLIGRQELIEHPDYATPEARVNRLDEVFAIVEEWTQTHDKFEVTRLLNEINVPCGPILDMKDLIEDDSMAKRGAVVEVDHPERGTFKTVGCPIRLSDSPVEVTTSPLLGEHTEEILKQIVGFADSEIEEARETGAI